MKTILAILSIVFAMAACNPVTVPMCSKAENFNYKQAKNIITSQKKVRKKQLKAVRKQRDKEIRDIKTFTRR